ncbi:MAG: glycosyltransferase family 2 protein [Pseudomonadota bacterium]
MSCNVSIFIQTLDEEQNIAACLECFSWSDDIVVLDSFSSDKTEEIAKAYGARWVQKKYEGRAAHQNWAMENIQFKYPWVYYSDADERVGPELAAEIQRVTSDPATQEVAFKVRRRDHFRGKWIKRSTNYPLWIVRLFRPDKIRWTRKANPIPAIDGKVGELENDYFHYPFSKGLTDWIWRHNRYSSFEAEETIRSLAEGDLDFREFLSSDRQRRRIALKTLSFRMPFRPVLKFMYQYILKRGFMDGSAGFHYCMLQSIYEYFIVLKVKEIKNAERGIWEGRNDKGN